GLQVDEYDGSPKDRIDVEVLEQRQEDRHEDHDDLGPFERPAQQENDRLRKQHELDRRHIERKHPLLDELLAAQYGKNGGKKRRGPEKPPPPHRFFWGGENPDSRPLSHFGSPRLQRQQEGAGRTDGSRFGRGGNAEQDHRQYDNGEDSERHHRGYEQFQNFK